MEPVSSKNRKPGSVSMFKIRLFQNLLHPEQYIIETVRVHAEITKWNKIIKPNMNCSFTTTCKDVPSCFGEPLFSDLYVFVCFASSQKNRNFWFKNDSNQFEKKTMANLSAYALLFNLCVKSRAKRNQSHTLVLHCPLCATFSAFFRVKRVEEKVRQPNG